MLFWGEINVVNGKVNVSIKIMNPEKNSTGVLIRSCAPVFATYSFFFFFFSLLRLHNQTSILVFFCFFDQFQLCSHKVSEGGG